MIIYDNIGNNGRLGNQLFQFASTIGIARKNGYEVKFPKNKYFDIPGIFDIPEELLCDETNRPTYKLNSEKHFSFDSELFKIEDDSTLTGYLQSEKYFKHCETELRQILTFKSIIQDEAAKSLPKNGNETVSIHVRVGDYKDLQEFHPIYGIDYYQKAVNLFVNQDVNFLVFSDDIPYAKNMLGVSDNITYINTGNQSIDLCLMSMCDHNIITNSSYSWWGSWLNKNKSKKIIAPDKWFGPGYASYNTDDLYCENFIKIRTKRTSVSDDSSYPKFCRLASENDNIFNNFRNDSEYKKILEHVTEDEGYMYLDIIKRDNNWLIQNKERFATSDRVGNPVKYKYDIGEFSPTTLRYIKVLSNLIDEFGHLTDKRIVEIGCGYGGQAKIIMDMYNVKSMTLIDLPEALSLAEKFLEKSGVDMTKVNLIPMEKLMGVHSYDLFISNYAFTECTKGTQIEYYTKVLSNSKSGYITANFINSLFNLDSLTKYELLSMIDNSEYKSEEPSTREDNVVITWK